MKIRNNTLLLMLIIFLNGCAIDLHIDTERSLVKTIESGFYTARWYINPNIEESKMLGSSTSDYGAAAEKKRDRYIIKYFDYQGKEIPQKDLKKIKSSRKFWRSYLTREQYMESKKHDFERNLRQFVFSDDNVSGEELEKAISIGNRVGETRAKYIKDAQKSIELDDWEDDTNQFYYTKDENGKFLISDHISSPHLSYVVIPIKQCFGNGWCEVYPNSGDSQTTFYVKESVLLDFAN